MHQVISLQRRAIFPKELKVCKNSTLAKMKENHTAKKMSRFLLLNVCIQVTLQFP